MFYDVFMELCQRKGVTPNKACVDCGLARTAYSKWKKGSSPSTDTLDRLSDYFGVSMAYLLERSPEQSGAGTADGRPMGMDDFTYAMQNETRDLTEMDKQILLSMAKQLNDARKKRNGETG